jgi:20S proteasome subunit alpha 6
VFHGQRNAEELSSYQKKLFVVDEHIGIAIAGLTSDARVLTQFMKTQCLGHRLGYLRPMKLDHIVHRVGAKAQNNTQQYGRRPYGVGLLIAGVDDEGTHLFEFQPSGMTQEMMAFAIGARSQMARTYLEKNVEKFAECSREELVRHGILALKESLAQDKDLTIENTSVGIVGFKDGNNNKVEPFKVYDGEEVRQWIDLVAGDKEATGGDDDSGDTATAEGMEVDS